MIVRGRPQLTGRSRDHTVGRGEALNIVPGTLPALGGAKLKASAGMGTRAASGNRQRCQELDFPVHAAWSIAGDGPRLGRHVLVGRST